MAHLFCTRGVHCVGNPYSFASLMRPHNQILHSLHTQKHGGYPNHLFNILVSHALRTRLSFSKMETLLTLPCPHNGRVTFFNLPLFEMNHSLLFFVVSKRFRATTPLSSKQPIVPPSLSPPRSPCGSYEQPTPPRV